VDHKPSLHTVIVEGPLAFAMRRYAAACAGEIGLQILSLPQLAARLVGGFAQPITPEILEPAIQGALAEGGFQELQGVFELPGITRAIARTLHKVWNADIDLDAAARRGMPRLRDLAAIENRVRARLPAGTLLPHDLCAAALKRIDRAPVLLGPVRIENVCWVPLQWRKLVAVLRETIPVEWAAPVIPEKSWFAGTVTSIDLTNDLEKSDIVSCADPHHEVVESLRWVRELLSTKAAEPRDIAIATASPAMWDEHFLGLAANSGLRIHFSHGVPALSVRDGQRCAALADILVRGLSEQRVRRLLALCAGERTELDRLPPDWLRALPRGASLLALRDWERVLGGMEKNGGPSDAAPILLPFFGVLARGPAAAVEAGALFLRGRSRNIWQTALRAAPPHAIELALQNIRLADENDPADSVVWGPAAHLAAWPRRWVRLLGLTSGGWPRCGIEDAILPDHVIPAKQLDPDPVAEADRRSFSVIAGSATGGLVLSRSRRNAQGNRLGQSTVLPAGRRPRVLARVRIPEHAFSESDRLMARPLEAVKLNRIKSASQCWQNWHKSTLTPHDGQFEAKHPGIVRALGRTQSPTSLQLLLRGPLGFVWKYGLGWWAPVEPEQPLTIAPEAFGKLVHELLRRAVDALEPSPGFALAGPEQIEAAVQAAAGIVEEQWPLEQPVPPQLLWRNTVAHAAGITITALTFGKTKESDTQSWTEVPFGDPDLKNSGRALPWDPTLAVAVPGTGIRIEGTIDRLDLRPAKSAVRVTDYKTGACPRNPERMVIRGGAELQRSLYALACRQLLPDYTHITARLLYLSDTPRDIRLADLDAALGQISAFVACACDFLTRGVALPGQGGDAAQSDLRLAMPASPAYQRRKRSAFAQSAKRLAEFWDAP
jgi:hypothetical protein